jgi:transcriptional regulator with XRE-family HTH domain
MEVVDRLMKQPELGKKIFELRQSRGLTQTELAENCRLSLRTVQRIEASKVTPRAYTIKTIFSCLGYNDDSVIRNQELTSPETNRFQQVFNNIIDLFNLKTNTMRKLSVFSVLLAIFVVAGLFLVKNDLNAQKIDGWFLAGSKPGSYKIGLDPSVYMTGGRSAFLESTDKVIDGFGTLMQSCLADEYLGKRIKMTAYIKSSDVSVWAGMWLRVDAKEQGKSLAFDNMGDRPIKGSKDWTKCEIILDVPEESATFSFGVLLHGTGKVWFDDISFEIVNKMETETTGRGSSYLNKKPTNLNF